MSTVLLLSLSPHDAAAQEPEPPTALAVAEELVAAFNQHDTDAMGMLVTTDFELYYVTDEGEAELAIQGRQQLASDMNDYFAQRPSVRSTITGAIEGPVFVSFREQIIGGESSLAVYEIRDSLVKRAWYFPAEKSEEP